jgi:hypothetical protein
VGVVGVGSFFIGELFDGAFGEFGHEDGRRKHILGAIFPGRLLVFEAEEQPSAAADWDLFFDRL